MTDNDRSLTQAEFAYFSRDSSDNFDVMGSLRRVATAVRLHRFLVIATTAATLALTILYVVVWPPIYQAEAVIMAERETDVARDSFYNTWSFFRKDDARTEIELLKSGGVLKKVIEIEKLTYNDVYHPVMSQLSYMWEKSWPGRGYKELKAMIFGVDEDDAATTPAEKDFGRTITDMAAGISVETLGEANVARVHVKGPSRRVAQIANTLLDVYLVRRTDSHVAEAQRSFDVLTHEIARAGEELRQISERRVAFLQRNGLTFDLQSETQEVKALTDIEINITAQRVKNASLQASLAQVEKDLVTEPAMRKLSSVSELSSVRESSKQKRLDLEIALIATRIRYREDSPEVKEVLESIAKLDTLIAGSSERVDRGVTEGLNVVRQQLVSTRNTLLAELEGGRASLTAMQESSQRLRSRLARVPQLQDNLRTLDRLYATAHEKFQALLQKRAQVDVALSSTKAGMPSLRVVDYARPPSSKWWPRLKFLYPGALLVGLILGVFAALLANLLSGRVIREHVVRGRGGVAHYGTINVTTSTRPLLALGRSGNSPPPAGGELC